MKTIYYTLRVFSSCQFNLSPIKNPYSVKKTETGKWEGRTAGGCGNGASRATFMNNPVYQISLEESSDENHILIDLKGPKQYSVGFEVKQVSSPRNKPLRKKEHGCLQYEKMKTIYYTLRVFSSCQFNLSPIKNPYSVKKTETGKWEGRTAGGCGNGASRATFMNNPVYQISLEESSDENHILIDLKGPKQYSVGFEVKQVSSPRNKPLEKKNTDVFRPGYTVLALDKVPAGVYTIRVMTFEAGQEGPFILKVEASCGFSMKRIQ
ncbi:calpain large subunit, domain III [Teladorsagia circumcincta]|uniref:Calpain large subunit, domain III n=1 Tax=Teladorsagia circumcincta TaxID=45464 RepID=A0A2G9UT09_TELCI|nr:calpain large subunit, domain III [Teladorsagia circumcincta]